MMRLVTILLFMAGIASAPLQIISGRENIDEALRMYGGIIEPTAYFTWLSRFINIVLAVLLLLITKKIIGKRLFLTANVRNVFLALSTFLTFNYGAGALFGSSPGMPDLYLVLTTMVLIILSLVEGLSPFILLNSFRYVASLMVLGSLVSGILFSDWSYMSELSYDFGDSFSRRLIGFFNHPSVLGVFALMLLMAELRITKSGMLRVINLIACPVVLVLTLSKTAIFLALIVLVWHFAKKRIFGKIALSFLMLIPLTLLINFPKIFSIVKDNENLLTLTGRVGLWDLLINNWLKNPLFGSGPAFFSSLSSSEFGHAHNVILQSMSDGGVFGLIGLGLYLNALFKIAHRNRVNSNYFSIFAVFALFLYSLTEPIFRIDSFVSGLFFINAFVILYLCTLDRWRVKHAALIHVKF